MAKLVNRAKMTTATTGTGTISLGSAVSAFQTFADAGVVDGDVVRYVIEDGTGWEIGAGTYTASGATLSRTVSESSNSDNALNLSGNAVIYVTAVAEDIAPDPDTLKSDTPDQLTAAFTAAVDDDGTQSSGTYTPSTIAGSNYKKIVNGGAFTVSPPTLATNEAVTLSLFIVNNASAGAITTSGFTKVTGDEFTTTDGDEFLCRIEVFNMSGTEFSLLNVVAMQ